MERTKTGKFHPQSCNVSSSSFTHNPVSALRIWWQFRRHFKFTSASTLMALFENHMFSPSLTDPVFTQWHSKGLRCFQDLYRDDMTFCSYIQLSSDLGLSESHLYRNFVIRLCSPPWIIHSEVVIFIQLWLVSSCQ